MTKPLSIFEPTYRAVIASWRQTFGMPEMPFGIVQTASCGSGKSVYGPGPNNLVQESQLRIHRTTPHTGIVVTTDEVHGDLHIIRKQSHGERAIRWAMAEVYPEVAAGRAEAEDLGHPVFKSAETKDNKLIVKMETMGGEALVLKGDAGWFRGGRRGQAVLTRRRRSCRQDHRCALERQGGQAGGGALRLVRHALYQFVDRERPAGEPVSHRRLAAAITEVE